MSDTLDLTGVIGTWVAVFLALVALLALLPAYFLYKRSRSQVAKALFKVDDPSKKFVSSVFFFGFLLRQTVRVPDLRRPPDPSILENARLENKPTAHALGPTKSNTGWIEFAHIITATFPGVKYGDSSLLNFAHEQTSLPVHSAWLIALGILHRYSMRKDCGLPIGAAIEASEIAARSGSFFSGLSGYLDIAWRRETERRLPRASSPEPVEVSRANRVMFKMHGFPSLQISLTQDLLSFRNLAILFTGYIDDGNGQFFSGMVHHQSWIDDYVVLDHQLKLRIAKVTETKFAEGTLSVLSDIAVQATKRIGLVLTEIEELGFRRHNKLHKAIREALPSLGLCKVGRWVDAEVWMLRKDAYRFACAYLKQKPSRHGFLYDSWQDLVVSRILQSKGLLSLLALAQTWLSKAALTGEIHEHVVEAVRNASEAIPILIKLSWSRRGMQAISSLDDAIDLVASQRAVTAQNKIIWMAIRTVYASNQSFRQNLRRLLKNFAAQDQQNSIVMLRIEEAEISLLEADDVEIGYSFDFPHVFGEAELAQCLFQSQTMPLLDTILACLQGQLRALAWKKALDPEVLKDIQSHAFDISFVETYVPEVPGPEIWLKSATHGPTSSAPIVQNPYTNLDVALAAMGHEYTNERETPDRCSNRTHGRTGVGFDAINTSLVSDGALSSMVPPPSAPLTAQLIANGHTAFAVRQPLQVEEDTALSSFTNAVQNDTDIVETSSSWPISAESGAESSL